MRNGFAFQKCAGMMRGYPTLKLLLRFRGERKRSARETEKVPGNPWLLIPHAFVAGILVPAVIDRAVRGFRRPESFRGLAGF